MPRPGIAEEAVRAVGAAAGVPPSLLDALVVASGAAHDDAEVRNAAAKAVLDAIDDGTLDAVLEAARTACSALGTLRPTFSAADHIRLVPPRVREKARALEKPDFVVAVYGHDEIDECFQDVMRLEGPAGPYARFFCMTQCDLLEPQDRIWLFIYVTRRSARLYSMDIITEKRREQDYAGLIRYASELGFHAYATEYAPDAPVSLLRRICFQAPELAPRKEAPVRLRKRRHDAGGLRTVHVGPLRLRFGLEQPSGPKALSEADRRRRERIQREELERNREELRAAMIERWEYEAELEEARRAELGMGQEPFCVSIADLI